MKILLDSNWLTVQFECNTSEKSVTLVQIIHIYCAETSKKVFSNEKKCLQEGSSGTSSRPIFSC